MYNRERKQRFIEICSEDHGSKWIRASEKAFMISEPFEVMYSKDICEFKKNDIRDVFEKEQDFTVIKYYNILKEYNLWNKMQGNKKCDDILSLHIKTDEEIKRAYVSSPEHLNKLLDETYQPVEHNGTDILKRAATWLYYTNLSTDEISQVRVCDIDFKNRIISVGNRMFEYDQHANRTFEILSNLDYLLRASRQKNDLSFEKVKKNFEEGIPRKEQKLLCGWLKQNRVDQTFRSMVYLGGTECTTRTLKVSGWFFNVYKNELKGMRITPQIEAYLTDDYYKSCDEKGKERKKELMTHTVDTRYGVIEDEYMSWKNVFYN